VNSETAALRAAEAQFHGTGPRPLTDRILSRLPGPRLLWLAVWALVPWVNVALIFLLQEAGEFPRWEDPVVEVLNRAAFSFAIVLSVWGAAKISSRLGSLRSRLSQLLRGAQDPMEPFRAMESTTAPVLLTAATVVIFAGQSVVEHGSWIRALVAGGSWLLIGIALWSFFWIYLNLQFGLHRLGRHHLSLEPYPADRSLGLRPLGAVAFTGFWTFVGALAPLLLASGRNRLGLGLGLLVLLAGVAAFFLSLRRLNRQMVAAKQRELAWTRRLYAQALQPVREEGTLETLQRQSGLLSAAEALEKRAERIQEWPFDEATFARVVTISSTVVGAMLARILLAPLGI
jgi:hypothetical protein